MKYKTYVIEDRKFNAVDLGKELRITQQTARNRLNVAKTIKDLYKPLFSSPSKIHIIEGKEFTSPEVSKILNCSDSTARARLGRCKTIDSLLTPLHIRSPNIKSGRIVDTTSDNAGSKMNRLVMGVW